jgi:hypothetical protein
MALTVQQQGDVARYWANVNFVSTQSTATFSLDQIQAAAASLDGAFDTTLSAAVAVIPAPFSTATAAQKTLLACYVLMKRAGVI